MTKITKKSSKKTFILISLAIALISILSFGATFAWFTAKTKDTTLTAKTGHVKLGSSGVTLSESAQNLLPGDTILEAGLTFDLDVSGTDGAYVALKITLSVDGVSLSDLKLESWATCLDGWAKVDDVDSMYIYGASETNPTPVKTKTVTINKTALVLPEELDSTWTEGDGNASGVETGTAAPDVMDKTITIKIQGYAIQAAHLDAAQALSTLKEKLSLA